MRRLVLDVVCGVGRNLSHPVAQQLESLVEQFNPDYNRKSQQRTKEVWGPKLMESKSLMLQVHVSGSVWNCYDACTQTRVVYGVVCAVWSFTTLSMMYWQHSGVALVLLHCMGSAYQATRALAHRDKLPSADGLFNLVDFSVHSNPLPMRNAKEAVELLEALPYIRVDMADHTKETFKKQLQELLETHYQAGKFDFPLETKLFILRPINSREAGDHKQTGHEGQVPFQFFPNRTT